MYALSKKWFFPLVLCVTAIGGKDVLAADALYKGEHFVTLAGFPAVSYFSAGEKQKPLIIFVPGSNHTARIAYGGHKGAKASDFLAYWLNKKGYNFLALSYPIETDAHLMPDAPPDFTAQDWGRQIAEATKNAVEAHKLTGKIYLIAWSMAGRVVQPAAADLQSAGHPLVGVFSFASTPGIPGLVAWSYPLKKTKTGNVDGTEFYGDFISMLKANRVSDEPIIPEAIYEHEYLGNMSMNLFGFGEIYKDGKITDDPLTQSLDFGSYKFEDYPPVVSFLGDSQADARHAALDQSSWAFYNTQTAYYSLKERGASATELSEPSWAKFLDFELAVSGMMSIKIGGNHLFFVGERGAEKTADGVAQAIGKIDLWNSELDRIAKGK